VSVSVRSAGLLALAVWLVTPAVSGVKTHEVSSGESVSSIAKRYYGTYDQADILLRFNGKTDNVIHAGEKLQVPFCDVHRVKAGDTWSGMSDRYVGRSSAYRSIARLNGLSPDEPLRIGQFVVMPVAVPYTLVRGDTLETVADRFYGDRKLAAALQDFNRIDDPRRLSVGQTIEVPLTTLRLRKGKKTPPVRTTRREEPTPPATRPTSPAPASRPAPSDPPAEVPPVPEPAPEPTPLFQKEIEQARRAFRMGEFDRARELVDSLREPVDARGTKADRGELLQLRAFVYVAFDLPDQACDAYRSLVKLDPAIYLKPHSVSPKIRATLAKCPGS
jgi:LysM repeat protein